MTYAAINPVKVIPIVPQFYASNVTSNYLIRKWHHTVWVTQYQNSTFTQELPKTATGAGSIVASAIVSTVAFVPQFYGTVVPIFRKWLHRAFISRYVTQQPLNAPAAHIPQFYSSVVPNYRIRKWQHRALITQYQVMRPVAPIVPQFYASTITTNYRVRKWHHAVVVTQYQNSTFTEELPDFQSAAGMIVASATVSTVPFVPQFYAARVPIWKKWLHRILVSRYVNNQPLNAPAPHIPQFYQSVTPNYKVRKWLHRALVVQYQNSTFTEELPDFQSAAGMIVATASVSTVSFVPQFYASKVPIWKKWLHRALITQYKVGNPIPPKLPRFYSSIVPNYGIRKWLHRALLYPIKYDPAVFYPEVRIEDALGEGTIIARAKITTVAFVPQFYASRVPIWKKWYHAAAALYPLHDEQGPTTWVPIPKFVNVTVYITASPIGGVAPGATGIPPFIGRQPNLIFGT